MSFDIPSITSTERYQGLSVADTASLLSASTSTTASNEIDLVALSAQALINEAGDVTGLDSDLDLTELVKDLSPTAIGGLLDSTSDQAVLAAVFGTSSAESLLMGVVSATTGG